MQCLSFPNPSLAQNATDKKEPIYGTKLCGHFKLPPAAHGRSASKGHQGLEERETSDTEALPTAVLKTSWRSAALKTRSCSPERSGASCTGAHPYGIVRSGQI